LLSQNQDNIYTWYHKKEKLQAANSQNRYKYFSTPARFSPHLKELILKVFDGTHPGIRDSFQKFGHKKRGRNLLANSIEYLKK